MSNVQVHPTRKIVVPNDRIIKILFTLTNAEYRLIVKNRSNLEVTEVRKHRRYGEISSFIQILNDNFYYLPDPLDQFDLDVANVCISEWEAGNRYVTYSTIYRTLTGRVGESDANPSKGQLAAIKHSLQKLVSVRLIIDLEQICEKLGYNDGNQIKIEDYIIPARFVDCTVNGQNARVIELTAESPLLKLVRIKNNQIISYDVELLNVPKQKNTPLNIELKHYAIRRVMETKSHSKQMTPSITFADVLEKCRIVDADNKKKHRVRETLKAIFEHLLACGEIDSYQVNKKAGVFYSISFTFSKEKRSKQEKAKKIANKLTDEAPSTKKNESEKTEQIEEQEKPSVEWRPIWSLEMPTSLHWKYRPYTLEIMPWDTGINALLRFLQNNRLFLF